MPVVQDDESKPGFVSTIILKFSQLDNSHAYKEQNKVSCPRHPSFVSRMEQKQSNKVESVGVRGTFQVDGEVSVKDRIKAYAQLTGAVDAAGWKNKTASSAKGGTPKNSRSDYSSLQPISICAAKSSVASRFLESVNKKIVKKESILLKNKISNVPPQGRSSGLVDKFSRMSVDDSCPPADLHKKVESVPVPEKVQPEVAKKASSSSIETEDSRSDDEVDRFQEYKFEVPEIDLSEEPVPKSQVSDDYVASRTISTSSSSSITELLGEFEGKDEDLEVFDPSCDSGYHPLPRSYIRNFTEGVFKLILPAVTTKSILRRDGSPVRKKITFSPEPTKVMETYSVLEYERGDDTIDPLTASAEWEIEKKTDALDKFTVNFDKDSRGLGLSIVGIGLGSEMGTEKLGIYIKALTPGGAAEATGVLREHDQILEVGGVSLVGVTQSFAAQTLKSTQKHVTFLIGREKKPESDEN